MDIRNTPIKTDLNLGLVTKKEKEKKGKKMQIFSQRFSMSYLSI